MGLFSDGGIDPRELDYVVAFVERLVDYYDSSATKAQVEATIYDNAWEIMDSWCECDYSQMLDEIGKLVLICYDWKDCDFGCTNLSQVQFWGYYQIYNEHSDIIFERVLEELGLSE